MEPTTRTRLVEYLTDTWDIQAQLGLSGKAQKAVLVFPKEETAKLHALIAALRPPVAWSTSCCPGSGAGSPSSRSFAPMRYELVPCR